MPKWEYKIILFKRKSNDVIALNDELCLYGEKGWEMCNIQMICDRVTDGEHITIEQIIFKRVKKEW